MHESKGTFETATDTETIEVIKLLARTEGIFAETAGGVTIAVLKKHANTGVITRDETVVAYVTGNGLKTQEAVINAVGDVVRIEPSLDSFEKAINIKGEKGRQI